MKRICWIFFLSLGLLSSLLAQPDGFTDQLVSNGWLQATGLTFDENGRLYVWEKAGKIWIVEDGEKLADPLVDITEEVGNWGDHGLLGMALHPNFLNNGYVYLLYVVDRHHLLYFGTSDYDPNANIKEQATIARVTRFQADPATNFTTLLPNSRTVLIGETMSTGIPLLHKSHGVGALVFGTDGSLMVTCGDGGSYAGTDIGGDIAGAYVPQALQDGILRPKEDVGAFRAQLVDNMNGKMLRIDPLTGDGISSNPFYDPAHPRAPQSRVWAMGLRNPFRFSLLPGTGQHDQSEGDPGVFVLGDVGWAYWEELNVVKGPGLNFGWPIYEGMKGRWQYSSQKIRNPDAVNPLGGISGCPETNFTFQDLLSGATLNPVFSNPCAPNTQIPSEVHTFVHQRPAITWSNFEWNDEEQNTYVPTFTPEGHGVHYSLEDAQSPVQGPIFNGNCSISGVYYTGSNFPEAYQNSFYAADYTGWIRQFTFNSDYEIESVKMFSHASEYLTALTQNPVDGCLYYIHFAGNGEVRRICYGGNPPPTAVMDFDKQYGPSPLTVQFSAAQSTDPEGQTLSYLWEFADGSVSTDVSPSHTFVASDGAPTPFSVRLTVTDEEGASHEAETIISLNNTPPQVDIISFEDGDLYTTTGVSEFPLEAAVSDLEHGPAALQYAWVATLHHNSHVHEEPADPDPQSSVFLSGEGCEETETFFYSISLTVTDGAGLSTRDEGLLYPYCGDPAVEFQWVDADGYEDHVLVEWESLTEMPGVLYEVQRSADGHAFATIGQISQLGQPRYGFKDFQPIRGENFYRIMVIRPDGFFEFSRVVTTLFPGKPAILVYPNPTQGEILIDFKEVHGEAAFALYDLQGKIVADYRWVYDQKEVSKRIFVPLLSPGWYIYRTTDGAQVLTGKVQKLR